MWQCLSFPSIVSALLCTLSMQFDLLSTNRFKIKLFDEGIDEYRFQLCSRSKLRCPGGPRDEANSCSGGRHVSRARVPAAQLATQIHKSMEGRAKSRPPVGSSRRRPCAGEGERGAGGARTPAQQLLAIVRGGLAPCIAAPCRRPQGARAGAHAGSSRRCPCAGEGERRARRSRKAGTGRGRQVPAPARSGARKEMIRAGTERTGRRRSIALVGW